MYFMQMTAFFHIDILWSIMVNFKTFFSAYVLWCHMKSQLLLTLTVTYDCNIAIELLIMSKQFVGSKWLTAACERKWKVSMSMAATAAAATMNLGAVPSKYWGLLQQMLQLGCQQHHHQTTANKCDGVGKRVKTNGAYLWNWVAHGSNSKCKCIQWWMSTMANGSNGKWQQWQMAVMANEWQWQQMAVVANGSGGKCSSSKWQQLQLSSTQWQFHYGGSWWQHHHLLWNLTELS